MLHHEQASLGDATVEFGWTPCFKLGKSQWNVKPIDIKTHADQHWVRLHGSAQSMHGFRTMVVASSDGAIPANSCDLCRSNGLSHLLKCRDDIVCEMEISAEVANLPAWQRDHVKARAKKSPKRKRMETVVETCVIELEMKLESSLIPVTIKALSDSAWAAVLWVEMKPQTMAYVCQFILEQGFADDRTNRAYVRRSLPKGVTLIAASRKAPWAERYVVKLPSSAIYEACEVDKSKKPRRSVVVFTVEEAQAVLDNPIAYVFPSATDDVECAPDNGGVDGDDDGNDEHADDNDVGADE